MASNSKDVDEFITKYTSLDVDENAVMDMYTVWADTYDKDLAKVGYGPHHMIRESVMKYMKPGQHILDAAAGTGLCGEQLRSIGFENIDALDGSNAMLDKAEEKAIYKNYTCAMMGPTPLPIANDAYDGVTITGAFAQGHLKGDCLPELIRITKPGGYIMIVIRAIYLEDDKSRKYKEEVIKPMETLEADGAWELVERTIKAGFKKDLTKTDDSKEAGLILVYRVKQ